MSTTYLSFASIAKLHNNGLRVVSNIGELSIKATTYAKDPGRFSLAVASASATQLVNFYSDKDGTEIAMPQNLAEIQIGIANWLYDQALLGNITSSRTNTLALLKAQFTNNISIDEVGEMATNNAIWLPSFVKGQHTVGAVKHDFYLWMADAYFRIQYPKILFTVVHPLPKTEMDWLMNANYQEIDARLRKETPAIVSQREHTATNGSEWPFTERNIVEFEIVDLINLGKVNVGSWSVMHWGNNTDAEDQLYEQMQNEILTGSKYTRPKWEEKIPDLFNPLEWYCMPRFDLLGVTDRTNGASTFSPIVDYETERRIATAYLTPSMSADHVIKSLQSFTFMYKSIQVGFVAKLNNRAGMKKLGAVYPDYQLISPLDSDFERMNTTTMAFVKGMEELIAAAEVVTPLSLLPGGVTRIERLGKVCVAKRIGKVKFVMFTRWQMVQDGLVVEN